MEHGLQLTESLRFDKTDDLGPECTQGISTNRFGLAQEITLSSMSLRHVTDGAKLILTMNNDMEILKDMFTESIKEVYQELDEIKRNQMESQRKWKNKSQKLISKWRKQ